MKAGLVWFEKGWVEYKFPNNSRLKDKPVTRLELVTELSSETPGTNKNWLSDITLWVNNVEVGCWTSPGDFGDRRGKYTPPWWKLEGSQYGLLKNWAVTDEGSYVDGVKISGVTLADLDLPNHHSVKVRIGVKEGGRTFGGNQHLWERVRQLWSGHHLAAAVLVPTIDATPGPGRRNHPRAQDHSSR